MKASKYIKLVGLIMALAVLPLQASYAGCGCDNVETNEPLDPADSYDNSSYDDQER